MAQYEGVSREAHIVLDGSADLDWEHLLSPYEKMGDGFDTYLRLTDERGPTIEEMILGSLQEYEAVVITLRNPEPVELRTLFSLDQLAERYEARGAHLQIIVEDAEGSVAKESVYEIGQWVCRDALEYLMNKRNETKPGQ